MYNRAFHGKTGSYFQLLRLQSAMLSVLGASAHRTMRIQSFILVNEY